MDAHFAELCRELGQGAGDDMGDCAVGHDVVDVHAGDRLGRLNLVQALIERDARTAGEDQDQGIICGA